MKPPKFRTFQNLIKFLNVLKLNAKNCKDKQLLIDISPTHIWTLTLAKECFIQRKYFLPYQKRVIKTLCEFFSYRHQNFFNFYLDFVNESSKFENVYTHNNLLEMLESLDEEISKQSFNVEFDEFLHQLLDSYIILVAMFHRYDESMFEILFVIMKIIRKRLEFDQTNHFWADLVEKLISLQTVIKLIYNVIRKPLNEEYVYENQIHLFILSFALKGYNEESTFTLYNFHYVVAQRTFKTLIPILDLTKKNFCNVFHKSIWQNLICFFEDNSFKNFDEYLNYISMIFGAFFNFRPWYIYQRIIPVIIYKPHLNVSENAFQSLQSFRSRPHGLPKVSATTFTPVLIDLFFKFNADILLTLQTIERFDELLGSKSICDHLKNSEILRSMIQNIVMKFADNPPGAIRALSFIYNMSELPITNLDTVHLNTFSIPKKFTIFLSFWLEKLNIFSIQSCQRVSIIIFHILRYVDKQKFIQHNLFELLFVLRILVRPNMIQPEKSVFPSFILKCIVKYCPLDNLKTEAALISRLAWTFNNWSSDICSEIYRHLLSLDNDDSTEILNNILFLPYEGDLKNRVDRHIDRIGYEFNPFEICSKKAEALSLNAYDEKKFHYSCKTMIYLSLCFDNEDEYIQCEALTKFITLWEENTYLFSDFTKYHLRQKSLEDDTKFNLKFPFPNTFKLDKWWKFFRFIILQLLKTIKFSKNHYLTSSAIGLIGAVNPQNFRLNEPFLKDSYREDCQSDYFTELLEFSNISVFRPQTRMFKEIFLKLVLRRIIFSGNRSFNDVTDSIRKLFLFFKQEKEITIFGDNNLFESQTSQRIKEFCKNHFKKEKRDEMVSLIVSTLQYEKYEKLENSSIFHKHEIEFLNKVGRPTRSLKQNCFEKDRTSAEEFFGKINPKLSYERFVLDFIRMLYHEYVFAPKTNDEIIGTDVIFSQAMTQISQRKNQASYVREISEKLQSLQIPSEMFELSYVFAINDLQLAHLILPSLIVFALSQVSKEKQIEFAKYFSTMIHTNFLEHHSMFAGQLGIMAPQLLCFLFDYFQDFIFNRRRLHDILIQESYIKSKVDQYDSAFSALNQILNRVSYLNMSKLCLRSKSFTRSLYYFEKFVQHSKFQNVPPREMFDKFSYDELMLLLEIYYQLEDKHALRGMNLEMNYFPDMLQKFYFSANNIEKSSQIVFAQNILHSNNLSISQRYLIQEFLAKYYSSRAYSQNGFDAFSKQIFNQLSLDNGDDLKTKCSSEVPSLICDAALDLNSWDILDEAFSSPSVKPFVENRISRVIKSLYDEATIEDINENLRNIEEFYLYPLKSELLNNHFNAFEQSYRSIVHLHSINDIQSFVDDPYLKLLNKNTDLADVLKSFKETTNQWYSRNRKVPYFYENNQNKFDIKQQIVRVQLVLLKVFKRLVEKRTSNHSLFETFFSEHNFLLYSELMRASIEQGNIEDASRHFISAYSARNEFYTQSPPGKSLSESIVETEFIVEASNILFKQNDKEGALDLVRKELFERYSELNKILADEVFDRIENRENDYNKINEIALELNLQLPERFGMLFNAWRTTNFGNAESKKTTPVKANILDSFEFRNSISQIKPNVIANYELLKLQYMVLAEESGALSLQAMKFCSDQINLLTECNPASQARSYLHMALYNWRYVQIQEELKTKLKKEEKLQIFKLRDETVTSILNCLRINSMNFEVAVPIMLATWRTNGMNEYLKSDCQLPEKRQFITIFEDCCEKFIQFAETGPLAVLLNYVDLMSTLLISKTRVLLNKTLKRVIVLLIRSFPFHMNWNLHRFSNQCYKEFISVAAFFSEAKVKMSNQENCYSDDLDSIRGHFVKAIQLLTDFSETRPTSQVRRAPKLNLSVHAQRLWFQFPKHIKEHPLILPFNSFLNIGLYNLIKVQDLNNFKHLFINSLEDNFRIMTSIQCPKVVSFRCEDGILRNALLKYGDDLRKDRLFMDFSRMFNQAQNGELFIYEPLKMYAPSGCSSRKKSSIRLYSVIPLSTLTGIIEWVPNLASFNSIITKQKEILGQYHAYRNIQTGYEAKVRNFGSAESRMKAFDHIVNNTPPVFQNWFMTHFANAHSWYTARQNYILSSAAYSAIGFIMGLGDRHGENIQFDTTNGSSVHIDFNCIFNYGECFQVPELVPFRLTQNMRAAMGVTEQIGEFSGEFENVLTTLREYKSLLLLLFLQLHHDPFQEWKDLSKRSNSSGNIGTNKVFDLLCQHMAGVRARLNGLVKRNNGHHYGSILSPVAQTNYLINQAIDKKNLALMFHGWRAYN